MSRGCQTRTPDHSSWCSHSTFFLYSVESATESSLLQKLFSFSLAKKVLSLSNTAELACTDLVNSMFLKRVQVIRSSNIFPKSSSEGKCLRNYLITKQGSWSSSPFIFHSRRGAIFLFQTGFTDTGHMNIQKKIHHLSFSTFGCDLHKTFNFFT